MRRKPPPDLQPSRGQRTAKSPLSLPRSHLLQMFARFPWLLIGVVAVGFILRLYRLDHQSLWYDEALSVTLSRLPLAQITEALLQGQDTNTYPPLYFYMLHGWFEVFGATSFQARLSSALFGTLAIPAIYWLGRRLFDPTVGMFSAILLAVSQLGVMYAQETRPYSHLLFLLLLGTHLFFVALSERRAAAWWGFVLVSGVSIYMHYYSALSVGVLLLYAFLCKRSQRLPLAWLVGAPALLLGLYVPWIVGVMKETRLGTLLHGQPFWFQARWSTLFGTINRFNNGAVDGLEMPAPSWSFVVGGVLFCAPALIAWVGAAFPRRPGMRFLRSHETLLALLSVGPVLAVILFATLIKTPYAVRYVAHGVGPYYLLVARGLSRLKGLWMQGLIIGMILLYSAYSLRANYFIPYKENYRGALAYLAQEYERGDTCVFLPFSDLPLQWSIYQARHPGLAVSTVEEVVLHPTAHERVWLVMYRRVPDAIAQCQIAMRKLDATHSRIAERRFFWVDVALYISKTDKAT